MASLLSRSRRSSHAQRTTQQGEPAEAVAIQRLPKSEGHLFIQNHPHRISDFGAVWRPQRKLRKLPTPWSTCLTKTTRNGAWNQRGSIEIPLSPWQHHGTLTRNGDAWHGSGWHGSNDHAAQKVATTRRRILSPLCPSTSNNTYNTLAHPALLITAATTGVLGSSALVV